MEVSSVSMPTATTPIMDIRCHYRDPTNLSYAESFGIFVNGWAVRLKRTPNVTMLQTYTPAAELSDTGDFVAEFTEQNHESLDETRRGSIQSEAVETKDDFN
jgi:hypothetical protein